MADDLAAGVLVRVLQQYRLRPFIVYAVYPSRRYLEAKVRTLLDHLRTTLSLSLKDAMTRVETLAQTAAQQV